MDPTTAAAVISGAVTLILGVLTWLGTRKRPGLAAADAGEHADPIAVVQKIATQGIDGMTPQQVSWAVTALAQTISSLQERVGYLERHELAYLRRIAVLEHIAVYSTDPPPRMLPPWPDEPKPEG